MLSYRVKKIVRKYKQTSLSINRITNFLFKNKKMLLYGVKKLLVYRQTTFHNEPIQLDFPNFKGESPRNEPLA